MIGTVELDAHDEIRWSFVSCSRFISVRNHELMTRSDPGRDPTVFGGKGGILYTYGAYL